jgi:hypothetical protein
LQATSNPNGSPPSRPADQRQPAGILRYSVNATDVRSIHYDLEDGRTIAAEPDVPTSVRNSLVVVFDRIDSKLPSAENFFGSVAKANEADHPAPRRTLAEATNRPIGPGQRRGDTTAAPPPTRQSLRLRANR